MGKCLFMRKGETHTTPVTGILAGDLAVGSSVYLMENGVAVEYLVVNQGIPSGSSLYDASCDGTWLLRKDIRETRTWHSSKVNSYSSSTINTYLNGTFFNLLGTIEQNVIKEVKIPVVKGNGSTTVQSGENGLSTKVFLPSAIEVGCVYDSSKGIMTDGGCLSYFSGISSYSNNTKRIFYMDGTATAWWLRSPNSTGSQKVHKMTTLGGIDNSNYPTGTSGIIPALVLPSTALFDEATMLLKGVK